MASTLLVGIQIGAALSGSFHSAFGSARSTSLRLGQAADELRLRHVRLGEAMARAMSHPTRNIGELRRQYDRLGATLEQLRIRNERLTLSMARGAALKAQRGELRGQAMETAGTALALGAPMVQSVRIAAAFQDQIKDIAITGEFSGAEEAKIGSTVREAAGQWNQTQTEIARGLGVLVAGGIQEAKSLGVYAPVLAKAATATRSTMDDLGSVALALKNNLQIGEAGFEGALNMLTYAGKRGQFEIRDMAKWLPALTPSFQALGVTGKEAVAEIGAALQIARKGAGSNDEAANNFKNFLQKVTAPDTIKDFEKAGIDLKSSMMNLRAHGLTPVQSMLSLITEYMQSKGPAAAGQFQKAMGIKDDQERAAALSRLTEAYKLGELFQDMQAMSFIRPAIANQGEMKDIKQGSMDAGGKGLLDADYKRRMAGASEQFKAFKIGLIDIGITIGDALLPPLTELLHEIQPNVKAFGEWSKQHPGLIKGVIGLVGGLLMGKLAFIGLKYGINLVLSPFNALHTSFNVVAGKWTLLRAMWQAGRFAPLISGLRTLGGGFLTVGRFSLLFGRGLLMSFAAPFMLAGRGVLALGKLLVGNLMPALRLAGQAVLWIGRAMLMNPIGLLITGIAVGAYLIYRNWATLKPWFERVWAGVKGAFTGGLGGILKTIANWSPLGLFYKAFAGVMGWFGVALPKNFTDFGGMLIDGLVNGVKSKLSAAKDTIVGFGSNIKGWFSSTLGIHSPSRVFMGFGDNIAQGAALGIGRSSALAGKAAAGMALATTMAWGAPQLAAAMPSAALAPWTAPKTPPASIAAAGRTSAPAADRAMPYPEQSVADLVNRLASAHVAQRGPAAGNAGAGMVVHFSPQITVQGGEPAAMRAQVAQAMQMSFAEFERMMKRYEHEKGRTSYGRNA